MVNNTNKPWVILVLLLIFLSCLRVCFSVAGDTLSAGQPLSVTGSILSDGGDFVLGFFRRGTPSRIYLGIWYSNFDAKDIIWVANREIPLSDASSSRLEFSEDRNLVLLQGSSKMPFWSTNLTRPLPNSTEAVLGDDGNFVLRDSSNQSTVFWQSFDHPTDTWLPGGKLGINRITGELKQLVSWKSSDDPAPGIFAFRLDQTGNSQYQCILEWNRSLVYWSTGFWDGKAGSFSLAPDMLMNYISNFSLVSNDNESYFTYYVKKRPSRFRFVIKSSGEIQQLAWLAGPWVWNLFWSRPADKSNVYCMCGPFSMYDLSSLKSLSPCTCLQGFKQSSTEESSVNDWSGGCVRNSPLQCEQSTNANGKKDWFLKMPTIRLPVNSKEPFVSSAKNCEAVCMDSCSCTAYAHNSRGCTLWEGAFLNLQRSSTGGSAGQDIHLRLAAFENLPVGFMEKLQEHR